MNEEMKLTFDELLEQLDEYVEQVKTKEVQLPIAREIYVVKALSSQDEDYIKSSTFRKYNQLLRKIFELILKKSSPKNRTTGLDFNTLSKEISLYDIQELSKALLEVTYETFKTSDNISIKCDSCNTEYTTEDINSLNLKYSDLQNVNNEWDKDQPFTEYTIKFAPEDLKIKVKNSDTLYITFEFELYIPTLYEYLHKQNILEKYKIDTKQQIQDLLPGLQVTTNFNEQSLIDIFPVKRDIVFMLIKSIRLKMIDTSDNNKVIQEEHITDEYKILQTLDRLPISVLDEIRTKHTEEFSKYVPLYKTTFKCKNCNSDIDIIIRPELNLIDRILS